MSASEKEPVQIPLGKTVRCLPRKRVVQNTAYENSYFLEEEKVLRIGSFTVEVIRRATCFRKNGVFVEDKTFPAEYDIRAISSS